MIVNELNKLSNRSHRTFLFFFYSNEKESCELRSKRGGENEWENGAMRELLVGIEAIILFLSSNNSRDVMHYRFRTRMSDGNYSPSFGCYSTQSTGSADVANVDHCILYYIFNCYLRRNVLHTPPAL